MIPGKGLSEVLSCPSGLLPACLVPPLLLFQKLGAWKLEGILSSPSSLACLNPQSGKEGGKGAGRRELTEGSTSAFNPLPPPQAQTSAPHTP